MSSFNNYLLRIILTGTMLSAALVSFCQQEPDDSVIAAGQLIDTSDYIPSFYSGAADYNLMIASSRGYVSEIDRLIKAGADVNAETNEGATPLIFAVSNNRLSAVEELLKFKPVIDKVTSENETPLIIAAKNDNVEICEALIRAGADVDFTDSHGATPLHYACIYGYFELADMLLYYDASIDKKSNEGISPLMASVMDGWADIADLLIQNGANMEARDNDGNTPFLLAAYYGDTLIMEMLYKKGVDIYATNKARYDALDLTISGNRKEATLYLLRISNKWTDSAENAINPYVVASKYQRIEIVDILKQYRLPGKVKLGIDQVAVTLSSRLVKNDVYTGFSLSFKEPFLNAGIITGIDMNLWYTRVLVKDSEHLFYQYMTKGSVAYAGLFKDFVLYKKSETNRMLFSATLLAGYSFGNKLKGTFLNPDNKFVIIPDASVKWNLDRFSISLGMEYITSQFYHVGPVWARAGFSYTLFFDKVRAEVKPIKWY